MPTLFKKSDRLNCIKKHVSFADRQFLAKSTLIQKILTSTNLSCDSREIKDGATFIAIKGETYDGHDFIKDLKKINCVIFADKVFQSKLKERQRFDNIIWLNDPRSFASEYASIFYDHPSRDMKIIGITGTNGKTTIAYYLTSFYQQLGLKTGLIGTIAIVYDDKVYPSVNTTPEPVKLQRTLKEMKMVGVEVVVMEMSSHALFLNRVANIQLDSVIFSNITQDHLDFHLDMKTYLKAKLLIFELLAHSCKPNKQVVLWRDSNYIKDILNHISSLSLRFSSYGFDKKTAGKKNIDKNSGCEITGAIDKLGLGYIHCQLSLYLLNDEKKCLDFFSLAKKNFPLIGEYNLLNLMGCLEEMIASGYYVKHTEDYQYKNIESFVFKCLTKTKVPGRVEKIENNQGSLIIVDYAHTPDALENIIYSLKKLPHKKLITLFGCGGDRDKKKRPPMGAVAGKNSDFVYITSDNPRTEPPEEIINMIVRGIKPVSENYKVIENREEAIKEAVKAVSKDEILLIAGKGHENYQVIGLEKKHFDDREMIKKYL